MSDSEQETITFTENNKKSQKDASKKRSDWKKSIEQSKGWYGTVAIILAAVVATFAFQWSFAGKLAVGAALFFILGRIADKRKEGEASGKTKKEDGLQSTLTAGKWFGASLFTITLITSPFTDLTLTGVNRIEGYVASIAEGGLPRYYRGDVIKLKKNEVRSVRLFGNVKVLQSVGRRICTIGEASEVSQTHTEDWVNIKVLVPGAKVTLISTTQSCTDAAA